MATYGGYNVWELNTNAGKIQGNSAIITDATIDTGDGDYILNDSNDTFLIGSTTYTYVGTAQVSKGTTTIQGFYATSGGKTYFFTLSGDDLRTYRNLQTQPGGQYLLCFMKGTRIATPDGEVAVETLKIGDLVLTAEGKAMPVRWIGRQTVSTIFADPLRVLPIRITAGALGENLPVRDLLVSPDHALLVDGVLIHAGALVNGTTIRRESDVPTTFTYYHVELADHSLILAEGVPAETFVDNVDRLAFDNWEEHEALYGDLPPIPELELPRAKAQRQVPMATRQRLAARAAALLGEVAAAA